MNKNVMKKWVKALRSGKYKQGQGLLKQTTEQNKASHCCLGVLCELYDDEMKKNKKKTLSKKIDNIGVHSFNKQDETLPVVVQKWAGLFSKFGDFRNFDRSDITSYDEFASLADMNDLGCSFKKIAKTIEKDWENL